MYNVYLWLGLLLILTPAAASEPKSPIIFTATPSQCVALHKGQTCYQDITFQWQTPDKGRFCLESSKNKQRLTCWNGKEIQQYRHSFKSNASAVFSLIHHGDNRPIANVKVVVTWVYKAPKQSQSGWRLF